MTTCRDHDFMPRGRRQRRIPWDNSKLGPLDSFHSSAFITDLQTPDTHTSKKECSPDCEFVPDLLLEKKRNPQSAQLISVFVRDRDMTTLDFGCNGAATAAQTRRDASSTPLCLPRTPKGADRTTQRHCALRQFVACVCTHCSLTVILACATSKM